MFLQTPLMMSWLVWAGPQGPTGVWFRVVVVVLVVLQLLETLVNKETPYTLRTRLGRQMELEVSHMTYVLENPVGNLQRQRYM